MSIRVINFDANGPWSQDGKSIFTTIPKDHLQFWPLRVGERVIATQEGEGWWATVVDTRELEGSRDNLGVYLRPDYLDKE